MSEEQRPSEVRASDAEREQVVERLRKASVEGRLTLEEVVERSEAAYTAKTHGELEELTRDLPDSAPGGGPAPAPVPAGGTASRRRVSRWAVAVMSEAKRRGRWRPDEELNAVAVMGSVTIDLRSAEIIEPEITINAFALMGEVKVIVPEGVEVDFTGFAFMGSRDEKIADVPIRPGTPLVRVRGYALMGSIETRSKPPRSASDRPDELPAWSPHAERIERRLERRQARLEERRARRERRRYGPY